MNRLKVYLLIIISPCLFLQARESNISKITAEYFNESNGYSWRPAEIKYHQGFRAEWTKIQFDDSAWETAKDDSFLRDLPASRWNGEACFRFNVEIDSSLLFFPFLLTISQAGASEIYFNGERIFSIQQSFDNQFFSAFVFRRLGENNFTVKYINRSYMAFRQAGMDEGFYIRLGPANQIFSHQLDSAKNLESFQKFFMGLTLAFGLLHFILFLFSSSVKSNLFYSLFLFAFAFNIYFDYQAFLTNNFSEVLLNLRIHRVIVAFTFIFMLIFIYSLLEIETPKQFWPICLIMLIADAFAVWKPVSNYNYLQFAGLIPLAEIIRVIYKAVKNKHEDIWIMAGGFFLFFLFSSYDFLLDIHLLHPFNNINNGYIFGSFGLFICMSVFLARDFSKQNLKILEQEKRAKEQEINRKILEAENTRKNIELEEARKTQLAMLPACLNNFPGLDVCFEMRTATEVGGDYYDFSLARDGTLNIITGDATGHGAKAGLMVATFKSLFSALGEKLSIIQFFEKCTEIIRKMKLGNLFISSTFLRIKELKFLISAAGMPPILIFRKSSEEVEELIIKGMPLGASLNFPYREESGLLYSGDIILIMSDGLPELFNEKREMLGYENIKSVLKTSSYLPANGIVQNLFLTGDNWRGSRPQDDDITLVVIKVI